MFFLVYVLMTLGLLAGCSGDGAAGIKKAGVLKVGVKEDVPGFSMLNKTTNQYEGMEIDLAKQIAKELLGDENKVLFTPVTAMTRGLLLENGDIDMVIATFSITEERKLSYNFSAPYFTDAVGLLVKKDAGIHSLPDLDKKIIGAVRYGTTKGALQEAADEAGVSLLFTEFETYPDIKEALDSGHIDVFSVDTAILRGYVDDTSVLLPDRFGPQNYGIATRFQSKALAAEIDVLVQKWLNDGTIEQLIQKNNLQGIDIDTR